MRRTTRSIAITPVYEPARKLDAVVRRINQISTLPQVARRILDVTHNEHAAAADLRAALEGDAALSARVLRYVNSSLFALRFRVSNLQLAIAYLGFDQIRNLAMTACVSDIFKKEQTIGHYNRSALWRHLVSVGICARRIAALRNLANFEDAFLAGLLHDIGIILEDQYVHEEFRGLMENLDEKRPLPVQERDKLGFDHTQLGEAVGRAWSFPEAVRAAIRHHHASDGYLGPARQIVQCVDVANWICTSRGLSSVGLALVKPSRAALASLSLTQGDLVRLIDDLNDELARHDELFALGEPEPPPESPPVSESAEPGPARGLS